MRIVESELEAGVICAVYLDYVTGIVRHFVKYGYLLTGGKLEEKIDNYSHACPLNMKRLA